VKPSPEEVAARQRYAELAAEMAGHRDVKVLSAGAAPPEVYDLLLDVRARLDRAEGIIQESAEFRARARRKARRLAADADEAYDLALTRMGRQGARPEYEGAQERYAQARLDSLGERTDARTAQRLADIADDGHERLRTSYFALRDIREELLTALRYLPWLSSLET
jgi:hypothetical protein